MLTQASFARNVADLDRITATGRVPDRKARGPVPSTRAGDLKGDGCRSDVARDRRVARVQPAGGPPALPLAAPQRQDRRGLARRTAVTVSDRGRRQYAGQAMNCDGDAYATATPEDSTGQVARP